MRLVDNDEVVRIVREEVKDEDNTLPVSFRAGVDYVLKIIDELPPVDVIPVWYIIRWYEKRYKLGSTVADDWERGLLKEKIAEMHSDFKNKKYLDNKQESERIFTQMVKEVIELYNDWEKENESNI